jgi:hypothetical protein
MFVTMRQYGYVCHIAIMWLWRAMFITLWQYGYMFVTLQKYGYVRHNARLCAMFVKLRDLMLCSSHCEIRGYVCHIPTIWLCWSHCDNKAMFVTLWQYDNIRHIMTVGLCLSYSDDRDMLYTLWTIWLCPSACYDDIMLITLRWRGYVHHNRQYGYVRHIVTIWLWPIMFVTLRKYVHIHYTMTMWLWPVMFVTLWQYDNIHHIMTVGLCFSYCDDRAMLNTLWTI